MTKNFKFQEFFTPVIRCVASVIIAAVAVLGLTAQAASASSLCSDGWVSGSTGSGTCSWHGGIASGSVFLPGPYMTYKAPTDLRVKKYANCSALRAQFVFGVRNKIVYSNVYYSPFYLPALYTKNKAMDDNKDGAICEVRKLTATVSAPVSTPAPTPTPTPAVRLGMLANPASPGQTVETAGFEFTLLSRPADASAKVCSYKVYTAIEGCKYTTNAWGYIDQPTGVDISAGRQWMAVNLRVKRLSTSLYSYPLSSWRFALYSKTDTSYWVSAYAPNLTTAELAPYAANESRNVTLYISLPKSADLSNTVFGILDFVESQYIESKSRYFYPIF